MNKIVFIGWGNVAQQLSFPFQSIGFEIVQVVTHHSITPFPTVHEISQINRSADVYFIAVTDDQLPEIVQKLPQLDGLVLHCSGSLGVDMLSNQKRHGVLYPLQTFRKETKVDLRDVPFFLESNSSFDLEVMNKWVKAWGGNSYNVSPEQKQKIHLAAVWAMNFSNAMYLVSEKILKEVDIPFEILGPLLKQAQANAFNLGPKKAQTGPAIRKDEQLIQKQSQQMTEELEKTIYLAISKLIQENT
jgi:predicted short-subunit dehydrogenase-like oxidoreductase (DUF2520 family)